MKPNQLPSGEELRRKLTPEQYHVVREQGTEAPFTGAYLDTSEDGVYRCVVCGQELFSSKGKYTSGDGWPSFSEAMNNDHLRLREDRSHGMTRTEVSCSRCGSHLGHLFPDGPKPGGQHYCINSLALDFTPEKTEPSKEPDKQQ